MNEADRKALALVVRTLYPYQPRYLSIPFQWAKRKLMRVTGLNRWDFDKWLLGLQAKTTSEEGACNFTCAFYLLKCDPRPASQLNYVLQDQSSYCFLQFDIRNEYMKAILAELEMDKDA